MADTKQTPKVVFNATDWVLGIKRWSKTSIDPSTGKEGSPIYFPADDSGINAQASDGKSTLIAFKDTRNAPPTDDKIVVMLKVHGGRLAYEGCPDLVYMNINPQYVGARFMDVPAYTDLCNTKNIPIQATSSVLDQYNSARL